MRRLLVAMIAAFVVVAVSAGCATKPAPVAAVNAGPRYPDFPAPNVPASLKASPELRSQHEAAWQTFQSGDRRRAEQQFRAVLARQATFYPAETGLGFVLLAGGQARNAEPRFRAALAANATYLPALVGHAEAWLASGQDRQAMTALERVLAVDPRRDSARTRLEFLRLRLTERLVEDARRARSAGRYEEARLRLEEALAASPASASIVAELAAVAQAARRLDEAERYARRAVELEPREPLRHVLLGDVLEARQQYRDAAQAYARALALEARPEWRARMLALREKGEAALLPAEFPRLPTAESVTRGEAAAFIGVHLSTLIERAPRRAVDVATDIRNHWAATWIVPVTRAGVMTIYSNHTFQPNAVVRRADLAAVMSVLIRLAATSRKAELAKWQAARPRFVDLAAGHVAYNAAALAVASGAMTVGADGRFEPARPASGRDLDQAVKRVDALAGL